MGSDPYGFPEAAPAADVDAALSTALWQGVASVMCAAVGPCLCYVPYLAAIPLGVLAIAGARAHTSSAEPLRRTAANAAMVSGITGVGLSVLVVLAIVGYVVMIGVFAVMGADSRW